LALVALAVSGAVYNWLAVRHLRSIYPPPGKLYAVNSKPMHLYCTGEGAPTVVLEAGMGNDSLIWVKVQPPSPRPPECALTTASALAGAKRKTQDATPTVSPIDCMFSCRRQECKARSC